MIDHYLFLFKKFLGNLLMPLPLSLVLLLWALLLLLRRKTRWLGMLLVTLATAILIFSSYAPLNRRLIADFESAIPAYVKTDQPVDYVVVLGSWQQSVPDQPTTSELTPSGIVRLTEGIRIYRLNPGSKLVFTGFEGLPGDPVAYPDKLKELAIALGVPEDDIISYVGPRDTREEAQVIATNFPTEHLVLVTTAAHMPRALGLFRGLGLDPVPAPTEHFTKPHQTWWTFPTGKNLAKTEYWLHEELGLLWAKLMGQVD